MAVIHEEGWLRYKRISDRSHSKLTLFINAEGTIINRVYEELVYGFYRLYNQTLEIVDTVEEFDKAKAGICLSLTTDTRVNEESYQINCSEGKCYITSSGEKGILYGTFALLRRLEVGKISNFLSWSYEEAKGPSNPLRMLNHWDNMDGSIERGYSGRSFFFENDDIIINERTKDYARLIASIGINGVAINNVNVKNAATELISIRYYNKVRLLSELFASFGITLYLSLNFAAPIELGGLGSSDPLDKEVINWWNMKVAEVWNYVPLLGGFLVKADSEGRPGPFTYGRTHADGANMLANAIKPYKGIVIWRCFVYNCQQDWRDTKTDRARAGYDNFMPVDGLFLDNVILQIKNGPMDFQVREPVSPLFGGLKSTNMMLEVQIAQEYTGQQRHVCYLIPWFKEILDTNTYCHKEHGTIGEIVSGKTYSNINCGMVAVTNTGDNINWTGHDLAAANLYGFGRLAFDTNISSDEIAKEWIILTFGDNKKVISNIHKILSMSWLTYEKYTSPLGIGWMVKPSVHYGPDVDGYEYDRWGTYHRANHKGIGVDRTKNGTNFISQYNEPLASIYENIESCPEELLLFFHHLPYTYVLSTGKTIIHHIYNTHFEGASEADLFLELWNELNGLIDENIFKRTQTRFEHQKEHAKEWRDVINSYFYRKSGIEDELGRKLY